MANIVDPERWINCKYRTSHLVIRWLPLKLAAWIEEIYGQELGTGTAADSGLWGESLAGRSQSLTMSIEEAEAVRRERRARAEETKK